ncbi:MAG: hypothetical protein QOD92_3485, partial [Acidimicrobiaceae bacterium]
PRGEYTALVTNRAISMVSARPTSTALAYSSGVDPETRGAPAIVKDRTVAALVIAERHVAAIGEAGLNHLSDSVRSRLGGSTGTRGE